MVYTILKLWLFPLVRLWVRKINGRENIPRKGGFIIAANHASYLDHYVVGISFIPVLDKKIHFLSKKEHFDNPIKAAWHTYVGAIPLNRQKKGKTALKWAIKALKEDKMIALHPEGTRSLTGKLLRAKTGVARLALAAKVPVIPVGVIGTFEILPKGKYMPRMRRSVINIGKPMHFDRYYNKHVTKKMLREITTRIMKEIAKLSNQKYEFD